MRTLFLIFWLISIPFFVQAYLGHNSKARPGQLLPEKALVKINFAHPLLSEGRQDWLVLSPELKRKCSLVTRSHFDEKLARQQGSAIYTVLQPQSSSSVNFDKDVQQDSFSFMLTTENKNLPLLQFSCDLESTAKSRIRHFTLDNVQEFIGQRDFFYKLALDSISEPTALQLMAKPLAVVSLIDLNFSQLVVRERIFAKNPYFKNGVISDIGPCEIVHKGLLVSDKTEERKVPSGTKFTTQGLREAAGQLILILQEGVSIDLWITCYYGDLKPEDRSMKRLLSEVSGGFKFSEL